MYSLLSANGGRTIEYIRPGKDRGCEQIRGETIKMVTTIARPKNAGPVVE
jgi:hypothetical protein